MKKFFNLSIFDILILLIVLISFFSTFLLSVGEFNVDLVLILSAVSISFILIFQKTSLTSLFYLHEKIHLLPVLLLILIAVLFRSEPYLYIMGGQDQGVYVNMSKAFEDRGEVFQIDQVRNKLKQENIKTIYDASNLGNGVVEKNKYEGGFLPGVYIVDKANSKNVFQFYHLHPLWMAIFGKIFGDHNRVYALVFFSLISIISFYLLAFELTNNRGLAFITGCFLAINPLHVFFSKFPVTEVVALAFTSSAFYYLVRYYKSAKEKDYNFIYLILSAGLMGCFFFTRISGFMYIPFFYMMLIGIQLNIKDTVPRRQLVFYVFIVLGLYFISVLYGLHFSYPYSHDIYQKSFSKVFGSHWGVILTTITIMLLLLFFMVKTIAKTKFSKIINELSNYFMQALPYLFLIVFVVGLLKIYQLGFTNKYSGSDWLDLRWHIAGIGWRAYFYSSLMVAIEYLSPFIFILFIMELFLSRKKVSAFRTMLLFFLFCFWGYIAFIQFVIPYQYYYARYLLSEVTPYTLLFTLTSAYNPGNHVNREHIVLKYFLIVAACIYFLCFSFIQFKGDVAGGAYDSLKQIANKVDKSDLILLDKNQFKYLNEIRMPLTYYFDKNLFLFSNLDEFQKIINSVSKDYKDIFILSQRSCPYSFLIPIDQLTYRMGCYAESKIIPRKFYYEKTKLFFYKFNSNEYYK